LVPRIVGSSVDVYPSWVVFAALVATVLYDGVNVIFAVFVSSIVAEHWRSALVTEVVTGEREPETAASGKEHASLRGTGGRER
jgi:hypothetical protein